MKDRIKALRVAHKLSQEEFALRLGIKQATVSRWESGASQPTEIEAAYICREFGARTEWLRDGVGEMRQSYDDALNEAALTLFRQLPTDAQECVIECLRHYNETGKWKHIDD